MVEASLQKRGRKRVQAETLVLPGEKIGVIEEFLFGKGTYEEEGIIRSQVLGNARLDLEKKFAEVMSKTRTPVFPQEGSKVVGEAGDVRRMTASLDIFKINGDIISVAFTGILHISSVSREYTKYMSQAVRSGDIVRAKVINTKNRITQLSIQEPEYGVVYAFCSKCGALLELKRTRLVCPSCGRVERRKVSKLYGLEALE